MTERQQAFADMWNAGAAVAEIAAALGISRQHVHQMRFHLRLPKRDKEDVRWTDATPEEIAERSAEVRKRWSEGERERRAVGRAEAWGVPLVRLRP